MKRIYTLLILLLSVTMTEAQTLLPTADGKEYGSIGEKITSLDGIESGYYVLSNYGVATTNSAHAYINENSSNQYEYCSQNELSNSAVVYLNVTAETSSNKTVTIQAYSGGYWQQLSDGNRISLGAEATAATFTVSVADKNQCSFYFLNNGCYINDNSGGGGTVVVGRNTGKSGNWARTVLYPVTLIASSAKEKFDQQYNLALPYDGHIGTTAGLYRDSDNKLATALATAKEIKQKEESSQEVTDEEYTAATTALKEGLSTLGDFIMPTTDMFLRFRSANTNGYLTSPASGSSASLTTSTTTGNDPSSIWYYTTSNGKYVLISYSSGEYANLQSSSEHNLTTTIPTTTGNGFMLENNISNTFATIRLFQKSSGWQNAGSTSGDGNITILKEVGTNTHVRTYAWYVEQVTDLPVTLNKPGNSDKCYGTLYLPHAVSLPSGVEAYYVAKDGGITSDKINLTQKEGVIPANTPVVLIGNTKGNINVSVSSESGTAIADGENLLTGTFLAEQLNTSDYYLGQYAGYVGFYKTDMTSAYSVHKAKLPASVANNESTNNAKGFAFDFGVVTGIDKMDKSLSVTPSNTQRYNLAGQRVTENYKGVVIVDGKKMIMK